MRRGDMSTTLVRQTYCRDGGLKSGCRRVRRVEDTEALFHGARALSRSDQDDDAIRWYRVVVAKYPRSDYAAEAQYLTGWLEFNRGRYREAIAPLEETLRRFPKSKWMDDALWFLGMAHYFLGEMV